MKQRTIHYWMALVRNTAGAPQRSNTVMWSRRIWKTLDVGWKLENYGAYMESVCQW